MTEVVPWIAVVGAMCALPVFGHLVVTGRRTSVALAVGVLLSGALPWLLPADSVLGRVFLAIWAMALGLHMADVAYGRYPDPAMMATLPRVLFAFLLGPDGRWPADAAEARSNRRQGLRRIGRGLAKQVPSLGLLALSTAWPELHGFVLLQVFWLLWLTYFVVTASFDVMSGGAMLVVGVWAAESFQLPPLAASPRDFWGRRWNLMFRNLVHRHIFLPLGGRDRAALGVAGVFAFSALVHEYIVVAASGSTRGHMTVFFALHFVATLGYGILSRRRAGRPFMPGWLAVPAHLAWLTATAWFFFTPMLQFVPIHEVRLW